MKESIYNIIKQEEQDLIIYNVGSAGVLKLNKEYAQAYQDFIENGTTQKLDLLEALKQGGLLVEDDLDEIKNLQIQSLVNRYNSNNLTLTIAPTMECNFKCTYCYEDGYRKNRMNYEVQQEVIRFIKKHSFGCSSIGISWYGGEPLLALDEIENMTNSIRTITNDNIAYYASIVTNGYYLTKKNVEKLKELKIERVQVTIDGPRSIHDSRRLLYNGEGTFDRIINNIKDVCLDIPIVIRINVDKTNINHTYELLNYIEECNLKGKVSLYLAPVDDINNGCIESSCMTISDFSVEEIKFQLEALNKGFKIGLIPSCNPSICGAVSSNSYVIDPKGDLYKCWNHIGREEERVGSILHNSFTHNIYKWLLYDPFSNEDCTNCIVLPACMGGCPYHKLTTKNSKCKSIKYNALDTLELVKVAKCIH